MHPRGPWNLVPVAILVLLGSSRCGNTLARGRYVAAADPGSRFNFKYVQDRETGNWVNRECEMRVSEERRLPDPLQDPEHGSQLHVSLIRPGSVESAYLRSLTFESRDGFRVWQIMQSLHADDLAGKVAYGIQPSWSESGRETKYDPMEIIPMPPLGNTPPGVWSNWMRPTSLREGGFGWWKEVNEKPKEPELQLPEYPFEMRCRLFEDEVPGRLP